MRKHETAFWLVLTLAAVLALFALSPWVIRAWVRPAGWEEAANFAQAFDAVSALFSGLAFASVVVALVFQQREMRDQQRQISRQLFENTFFGVLRQHNEIVSSYRAFIAKHGKGFFGREGIQMVRRLLEERMRPGMEADGEAFGDLFKSLCLSPSCYLGHYLRNLWYLLRAIDEEALPEGDKQKYAGILRAQLSDDEMALVFYYGASPYGRERMKGLLEKYRFFEDLFVTDALRAFAAPPHYGAEAFGESAALWRGGEPK